MTLIRPIPEQIISTFTAFSQKVCCKDSGFLMMERSG